MLRLGKRPALFKSGQWHFQQDNAPVPNSILVTDYLSKMGIKTLPQPPYSPDLAPCDFCLFPKLRGCRYETIEEMKEAVTKVIDLLTQEDFYEIRFICQLYLGKIIFQIQIEKLVTVKLTSSLRAFDNLIVLVRVQNYGLKFILYLLKFSCLSGKWEHFDSLVCWVLWHINLCRLLNAKSIFM